MSTEEPITPVGERRRRRTQSSGPTPQDGPTPEPESGESGVASGAEPSFEGGDGAVPLSRRALREARQREEARRALEQRESSSQESTQEASAVLPAPAAAPAPETPVRLQPAVLPQPAAPPQPPVRRPMRSTTSAGPTASGTATGGESAPAAPPTPSSSSNDLADPGPATGSPNRRSMRDRWTEGPAGPAGRGERVPAARPAARPPAAAQGVRSLDETGALSQVRSTRASEDSPVEVTGPLDWSSAMIEPIPAEPVSSGESPASSGVASPASSEGRSTSSPEVPAVPARRSVLSSGRSPQAVWQPVLSGGRGATVPQPEAAGPPDVEGVFGVGEVEHAEGIEVPSPERRGPFGLAPLRFALLVLLGVVVGGGIFLVVQALQ